MSFRLYGIRAVLFCAAGLFLFFSCQLQTRNSLSQSSAPSAEPGQNGEKDRQIHIVRSRTQLLGALSMADSRGLSQLAGLKSHVFLKKGALERSELEETPLDTPAKRAIQELMIPQSPLSPALETFATQVRPLKTNWATPGNHKEICSNMNAILLENGVESPRVRERMIAHAIVASGWRQSVWNYNAWGVQAGSWGGLWFTMNTIEEDVDGDAYLVRDASWRAFTGWDAAVEDYFNRIRPDSKRPSYRKAYKMLMSPDTKMDAEFWSALGEGNYYTAQQFKGMKFAILCGLVRRLLNETAESVD